MNFKSLLASCVALAAAFAIGLSCPVPLASAQRRGPAVGRPAARTPSAGTDPSAAATTPATSAESSAPMRVVVHLEDHSRLGVAWALQDVIDLIAASGANPPNVVIIAQGPAAFWFQRDETNNIASLLSVAVATRHVEVRVGRMTLEPRHTEMAPLLAGTRVIESGTLEILRLQQQGYLYFSP